MDVGWWSISTLFFIEGLSTPGRSRGAQRPERIPHANFDFVPRRTLLRSRTKSRRAKTGTHPSRELRLCSPPHALPLPNKVEAGKSQNAPVTPISTLFPIGRLSAPGQSRGAQRPERIPHANFDFVPPSHAPPLPNKVEAGKSQNAPVTQISTLFPIERLSASEQSRGARRPERIRHANFDFVPPSHAPPLPNKVEAGKSQNAPVTPISTLFPIERLSAPEQSRCAQRPERSRHANLDFVPHRMPFPPETKSTNQTIPPLHSESRKSRTPRISIPSAVRRLHDDPMTSPAHSGRSSSDFATSVPKRYSARNRKGASKALLS